MTQCCVEGCSGIGTHRFPTNPKLRALWIKAIRREDLVVKDHTRLCRRHFLDSDFSDSQYHEGDQIRTRLRGTAVPTLFLFNDNNDKQKTINHLQIHAGLHGKNMTGNKNQQANSETKPKNEKLATEPTQYHCNACHESFATRCLLYYHKIFHPQYCNVCKKSFKTLRAITIHECTVCPTCEEDFTSVAQLNLHKIKSKCKKKPKEYCKCCFYCPNCLEQFAVKKNLKQHIEAFKYPCHICKKCYGLSEEFEAHVQSVHQIKFSAQPRKICRKVWLCSICKAKFNDRTALDAHMRRNVHQVNIIKAGATAIGQINSKMKLVSKVEIAVDEITGAVCRIANKRQNLDKGSLETIGDVEVKKEPDDSAPVWLDFELKKEPMELQNVDEIVEVKKESEWADVKIETVTGDVVVEEELVELQMFFKEEPQES